MLDLPSWETSAGLRRGGNKMIEKLAQKAMTDHKTLAGAYVSGAVAAIIMRYVASVSSPGIVHLILALIAVGGIVGAYLCVARSNAEAGLKAATIVGAAVVSGLFFALVSLLV
jgi:hypothetical protein